MTTAPFLPLTCAIKPALTGAGVEPGPGRVDRRGAVVVVAAAIVLVVATWAAAPP
jgi:hypothetical protein